MKDREIFTGLITTVPFILRLDGRSFHHLSRNNGYAKPYDPVFSRCMVQTAQAMLENSGLAPSFAYTFSDEISLYAMTTKKDGSGPYGWVDYVKLKQTKKAPEQWQVLKEISLEAENYAPEEKADYDTSPESVVNLADPSYRLELPITLADGFPEEGDDYLFTMYTTGVMRSYEVEVNGQVVLSGERAGSG